MEIIPPPQKNTKAETTVQKDTEDGPKKASGVNRETVVVQTHRHTKGKKQQKEGERKTQKRKKVPGGKETTFNETASTPDTETVQNNKNLSEKKTKGSIEEKAVPLGKELMTEEEKPQELVREEQHAEPPGSKRRKWDESKGQDRRREKLRRMLHGQSPEKKEKPAEQEETRTTEEVKEASADRSTALRSRMEQRLESARFRYINEVLYTTSSGEAKRMFRQDPQAFSIYHRGFTAQVQRWPANPVDAIISYIRRMPASLVVADFGCGDCKIALSLKNKVHSFDLAPICDRVTVCDMANVPLKDGTVDIAVFCLSLMGTNLVDFLVEANRVLVMGGILKIAEVASRFENVRNFMGALSSLGFKLVTKDTENSHFYSFEFEKIAEAPERVKKAAGLELRPCLYKKR